MILVRELGEALSGSLKSASSNELARVVIGLSNLGVLLHVCIACHTLQGAAMSVLVSYESSEDEAADPESSLSPAGV